MLLLENKVVCASSQSLRCYELATGRILHTYQTPSFSVVALRHLQYPSSTSTRLVTLEVRSESGAGDCSAAPINSGWVEFAPLHEVRERQAAWLIVSQLHMAFYRSNSDVDLNEAVLVLPCREWELCASSPDTPGASADQMIWLRQRVSQHRCRSASDGENSILCVGPMRAYSPARDESITRFKETWTETIRSATKSARVCIHSPGWLSTVGTGLETILVPVDFEPTALDVCPSSGLIAIGGPGIVMTWRVDTFECGLQATWVGVIEFNSPSEGSSQTHESLVTSVSIRGDFLAFATAQTARVVKLVTHHRVNYSTDASRADVLHRTVQFLPAVDGSLQVFQPALEIQGGDGFEILGPTRDPALDVSVNDDVFILANSTVMLWKHFPSAHASSIHSCILIAGPVPSTTKMLCLVATGRQGFLYDVANPFFVAPYHFARGSLVVDADRFFIYNITAAGSPRALEVWALRDATLLRCGERLSALRLPPPTLICHYP
eukprot:SAG11_NODE_4690_length_1804_cov_2.862757_1_plen_493_part_10